MSSIIAAACFIFFFIRLFPLAYLQVQAFLSGQHEPSSTQLLPIGFLDFAETFKTIAVVKNRIAIPAISHLYFLIVILLLISDNYILIMLFLLVMGNHTLRLYQVLYHHHHSMFVHGNYYVNIYHA